MTESGDKLPDQAAVEHATATLDAIGDDWMARRGVVSVEVARQRVDGVATGGVAIRVTLERLLPRDEVPDGELFPNEVDGVAVDLVEGSPLAPE